MSLVTLESQEVYRGLCDVEASIPLFSQAWWLDAAVGPKCWGVILASRGGEVVGALPYTRKRRWGMTLVTQPPLSQFLGPWVRPSRAKYVKALTREKEIVGALAAGLPHFDIYRQNWHWARGNWLPFYWRGFEQTTRYTYRLDLTGGEENIWGGLRENIRSDIRKALDRYSIRIHRARGIDELLDVTQKTFQRQGKSPPYPRKMVYQLHSAVEDRGLGDILMAATTDGTPISGAYIVRDATTAYYLIGGGDPKYRNTGAGSLCLWEAIRQQPKHLLAFDFEGSMLEPIERFFRAFGGRQVPYFKVTKAASRKAKVAVALQRYAMPKM